MRAPRRKAPAPRVGHDYAMRMRWPDIGRVHAAEAGISGAHLASGHHLQARVARERPRHRLTRAENRRMNHMNHIAAISQISPRTDGRACGATENPGRSTCSRTSTLRISHFTDPRNRLYST